VKAAGAQLLPESVAADRTPRAATTIAADGSAA
jgi:hypothetical protein